ncbi:MAG: methylglyoxal synthase [Spirochaetaceae bacterium]|nr:methylglyoxal synthase [Spirochaetaceae bacterium]|tara:strand:- start:9805 stop:10803 length:999 start_codon:yes stop_codon:yes gene_type:complete
MQKTLIGAIASHDSVRKNVEFSTILRLLYERDRELLSEFHFLMTRGTFNRCVLGKDVGDFQEAGQLTGLESPVREFMIENTTILPRNRDGGVILLSNLMVKKRCSLLWTFLTPTTTHWMNPELLALIRLSDVWRAKRLLNFGSVEEWFTREASRDRNRRLQPIPPEFKLADGSLQKAIPSSSGAHKIEFPRNSVSYSRQSFGDKTVALIAHDEMKPRMIEFCVDFEFELARFKRILTTGTTGKKIMDATSMLKDRIVPLNSGPLGGDIEIAVEVLFDQCDVIIFFVDPLHPHPHTDDIRVVFAAAMRTPTVRVLANEMQAREWMDRVVRESE